MDEAGFRGIWGFWRMEDGGEGNKAREQKEKRVGGVWATGPRRAGGWGVIYLGLIDWLID